MSTSKFPSTPSSVLTTAAPRRRSSPAVTVAFFTEIPPAEDSTSTSLPAATVAFCVPFSIATPDPAAMATEPLPPFASTAPPRTVTVVPAWMSTALAAVVSAPFAATVAPSTVTAPVASMSTFSPASTFAPVLAVTDAPSSFTVVSEATFALFSAVIAPVVFAVRSPFVTSCASFTVSDAVVLPVAVPTFTVKLPPTNALSVMFTPAAAASVEVASIVIAPCDATFVPSPVTVTPSLPSAVTLIMPDAPTFAPLFTSTLPAAVTVMFAASPFIVTAPCSSTVNEPAFTSVPLPVIVTSFLESRVTPVLPYAPAPPFTTIEPSAVVVVNFSSLSDATLTLFCTVMFSFALTVRLSNETI